MLSRIIIVVALLFAGAGQVKAGGDPTRPGVPFAQYHAGEQAADAYALTAIFSVAGHRQAVINGQLVSEGDRLPGARVSKINRSSVTLEITRTSETMIQVVRLQQHAVKQDASEDF